MQPGLPSKGAVQPGETQAGPGAAPGSSQTEGRSSQARHRLAHMQLSGVAAVQRCPSASAAELGGQKSAVLNGDWTSKRRSVGTHVGSFRSEASLCSRCTLAGSGFICGGQTLQTVTDRVRRVREYKAAPWTWLTCELCPGRLSAAPALAWLILQGQKGRVASPRTCTTVQKHLWEARAAKQANRSQG